MTERLKPAIVRFWDTNNKIVGTGVLTGARQVITCAHVVRDALNLETTPKQTPNQKIKLDFPFPAPKIFLLAEVRIWKPREEDGSGDIAGLEITEGLVPSVSRPVNFVLANEISELSGHSCLAYGFPDNFDIGVWSSNNRIQDERSGGTVQVTNESVTGHRIQKGFSGGAIWDKELQGVVGIITTADNQENNKVAFMLPTKAISKICPLPEVDDEDSTVIEIPFIVLAMTQPQTQDLLSGEIFQHPEVARNAYQRLYDMILSFGYEERIDLMVKEWWRLGVITSREVSQETQALGLPPRVHVESERPRSTVGSNEKLKLIAAVEALADPHAAPALFHH